MLTNDLISRDDYRLPTARNEKNVHVCTKVESNYHGYNEKPSSQNFFIRFFFDNSIAKISLYALSYPKFNFAYYFTFEIVF